MQRDRPRGNFDMHDMNTTAPDHEQVDLTAEELDNVAKVNAADTFDLPVYKVWIMQRTPGAVFLAGICPLCGASHAHGLNANARRAPDCHRGLPQFLIKPKPDQYALRIQSGPPPYEVRQAYFHEPADLRTAAAAILPKTVPGKALAYGARTRLVRGAYLDVRYRPSTRKRFQNAYEALARSGVFEERVAKAAADGERDEGEIYRQVVARFVAQQGPGRWRKRLYRALDAAWHMIVRGELA